MYFYYILTAALPLQAYPTNFWTGPLFTYPQKKIYFMLGQQPDLIALCKGALISTRVKLECQIAEADDEKDKKK